MIGRAGAGLDNIDVVAATKAGVVVVNESFARQNWGALDPVGHRVHLVEAEWSLEVVGVVQDVIPFPGDEDMSGPAVFTAQRQSPRGATFLVLRTRGEW